MTKAEKEAAKAAKAAEKEAAKADVDSAEEQEENTDASVDVLREGNYIRTYSLKEHGPEYAELAQQFIQNYPMRKYAIVPSSEVKEVLVLYREKEDAELPLDKQKADSPMVSKEKRFTDKEAARAFIITIQGRTGMQPSMLAVR